jgi:hypothetical protein
LEKIQLKMPKILDREVGDVQDTFSRGIFYSNAFKNMLVGQRSTNVMALTEVPYYTPNCYDVYRNCFCQWKEKNSQILGQVGKMKVFRHSSGW